MLTSVKFKGDYICFTKGQKFPLTPVTLLVGDQGCGKSTMLRVLRERLEGIEIIQKEPIQEKFLAFDCEMDNPRIQQGNPNDSEDMLYKAQARFQSHGEVLLPILKHISRVSDTYISFDEPETSLSLRSQYLFIDIIKEAVKRNNQIVIATHNLVFMEAFPNSILSLEHNKYVTPSEFIELEKQSNDFKDIREDKRIKKENCKMGLKCTCAEKLGRYNNRCRHYIDMRKLHDPYARETGPQGITEKDKKRFKIKP